MDPYVELPEYVPPGKSDCCLVYRKQEMIFISQGKFTLAHRAEQMEQMGHGRQMYFGSWKG